MPEPEAHFTLSTVLDNCVVGSNADPIISLALMQRVQLFFILFILEMTVFICAWKVIWGIKLTIDVDDVDKTGPLLKSKKKENECKLNCDCDQYCFDRVTSFRPCPMDVLWKGRLG